eukprot:1879809-Pyramimonas_sp.AAC.1
MEQASVAQRAKCNSEVKEIFSCAATGYITFNGNGRDHLRWTQFVTTRTQFHVVLSRHHLGFFFCYSTASH